MLALEGRSEIISFTAFRLFLQRELQEPKWQEKKLTKKWISNSSLECVD